MRTCTDCGIDYYRKTFIGMERVVCCGEVKFLPEYITEPLGRKQRCYRCNRLHREQYKREQYKREQHKRKQYMRKQYKKKHPRPTLRQRVRKVLREREEK